MSADDPYNTELGFKLDGTFDVSERVGDESPFETLSLVESPDVLSVEFGYSEDGDVTEEVGFFIGLSCHHVKNEETGRVFHANLRVHPDREQVKRIRNFCDYLLKLPPIEGESR